MKTIDENYFGSANTKYVIREDVLHQQQWKACLQWKNSERRY